MLAKLLLFYRIKVGIKYRCAKIPLFLPLEFLFLFTVMMEVADSGDMIPNLMSNKFSAPNSAAEHIRLAMQRIQSDMEATSLFDQKQQQQQPQSKGRRSVVRSDSPAASSTYSAPVQFDLKSYISGMLEASTTVDDRDPWDPSRSSESSSSSADREWSYQRHEEVLKTQADQDIEEAKNDVIQASVNDDETITAAVEEAISVASKIRSKRKNTKGKMRAKKTVKQTASSSPRSESHGSDGEEDE